ncbi:MAG: peroxiredoxin, partial [Proteobacteria bacterium]|nr:peroxiredoxin [Pseudomonadota bacterium]
MSVLVGKPAPDFTAAAVMADGGIVENFTLSEHIKGKYGFVFFYPLDFTFVCPSEILAFHNRIAKFKELNTAVIGISVDSHFSHAAWRNTPTSEGGLGPVDFPLVADIKKTIARDYDVLVNDDIAYRGSFLIDKGGVGLVGVEGAFSKFDFSRFRFFENKAVTRKVIQAYMDQNYLAAPSFVGITSEKEPPLFLGIDDKEHYDANVEAYRQSLTHRDDQFNKLSSEKIRLSKAKQTLYSPMLKRFDLIQSQHQSGNLKLGSYAKILSTYETEISLPLEQFINAYEMEKSMKFEVVERERKKVIEK